MNNMASNKKKIIFITALSTLGAAISIWQTYLFQMTRAGAGGGHTFCNIGSAFDCTAIEMSKYAELADGIPLSGFAIAGYLVILILALYGLSEAHRNHVRKLLLVFSGIAALFSVAYLLIMVGTIGKFCLLCLGVDAINFAIVGFTLSLKEEPEGYLPLQKLNIAQIAGVGTAAMVAALLITKATNPIDAKLKEDLKDRIQFALSGPTTSIPMSSDTPTIGKADAPITIVKFFDFQCPGCKIAANSVHPLIKRYPNEVKFAFFNFPLDMTCNPLIKNRMHEFACEAAALAICAHQQGKFDQAYTILFENQEKLGEGKLAEMLSTIPGMDLNQLISCSKLPSTLEQIKKEVAVGDQLKIESTPTFYLNGKKIVGGLPTSAWIEMIETTLKGKI
jgi:protein-disulfide isomerase/uncharacterized membrane protein